MKTKLIGITGGIGSGKSFLSRALERVGYAVYDTDEQAKKLINENESVRIAIRHLLGEKAYQNDVYNRQYVASLVFEQPDLLSQLNAIVHPVVREDLQKWVEEQHQSIVFVESAIMFQSGLAKFCDAIIYVTAPRDLRIERVVKRNNVSVEQVVQRIDNQLSEEEILVQLQSFRHLIIKSNNTRTEESLVSEVEHFLTILS